MGQKYRLAAIETDETDISLDKHISEENSADRTIKNEGEYSNNPTKIEEKETNYMHENDDETTSPSYNVSYVSQGNGSSENVEDNDTNKNNIAREHDLYWIQSLGLWGCKYCDLRLDKFGMQNTPCNRNKKAKC
jgi:hypothetical protein